MSRQKFILRWSVVIVVILVVTGLFALGIHRLQFDTDILSSLPQDDPVLADAHYVILHHPIHDQVVVDVGLPGGDIDTLLEGAALVEARIRDSGLFKEVGIRDVSQLVPELIRHITDHLPTLFSEKELDEEIKPLLASEKIHQILAEQIAELQHLGGIGQAGLISEDPLGLRNFVLARLSSLSPVRDARFYKGQFVSPDGGHILIIAKPLRQGMDTQFSRLITSLMADISSELDAKYGRSSGFVLTPVGSYRAALDNEINAERNIKKALFYSTIAIIVLLFVSFPRPLIGLVSLVPAFAGTMMALFVYSLIHTSISMLAIGFGGAIISFTVDYGIAYLLFLDRPYQTHGLEATMEVWSLGLLAMLTTAVSFAFLSLSGFPALQQIGQFTALGVVFTYIFVHAIFPLIFPVVPPAARPPYLPLQRYIDRIASAGDLWKTFAALSFGIVMLFFAKPEFHLDLNTMNAVSPETLNAEKLVRSTWGDVFERVYLMIEGRNLQELQQKSDGLADLLDQEVSAGRLSKAFIPSMIFPGKEKADKNFAAWQRFWNPVRIAGLRKDMRDSSQSLGFSSNAFDSFFILLDKWNMKNTDMPSDFSRLLGISANQELSSFVQVATLTPGPSYAGEEFYSRVRETGMGKVFDPALFSERFGSVLFSAFIKMACIVGIATVLTAFLCFLDWQLTLISIVPTLFALVCTLGTMNLMGQPLGIPTLMVAVVVIGMGTDYALYLVRSYQRYLDESSPSLGLIRLSVFLSFATTFLGFGVLALSDNAMLKSAGLSLSLGIGYSFLGAVTIAPPLLKRIFARQVLHDEKILAGSERHFQRIAERYRHMEAYPRLFAWFKIKLDPMFPRIADFAGEPEIIVDIGTGYGVPGVWLLEIFPRAKLYGLEPDPRRVRFASRVIGAKGFIRIGKAPEMPDIPDKANLALLIDIIHHLDDDELRLTLKRIHGMLCAHGKLVIRVTVPSERQYPWRRWIEMIRIRIQKGIPHFRSEDDVRRFISKAGFEISLIEPSAPGREEWWFVAKPQSGDELSKGFDLQIRERQ
jgi:uncharacterized protein